jgi:hypothetical protein
MATMPIVNPMPPFDPDSDIGANIGPKWKIWMEDFEMYITANGITDKAKIGKKRALLLYQAGVRVREIFGKSLIMEMTKTTTRRLRN